MAGFFAQHGPDRRFPELAAFMLARTRGCLSVLTFGLVPVGRRIIRFHQAVALPFSVIGRAAGFRLARGQGLPPRDSAFLAGIAAPGLAVVGLAVIGVGEEVNPWTGTGGSLGALSVFPILFILGIAGVLWLCRAGTWPTGPAKTEEGNRV